MAGKYGDDNSDLPNGRTATMDTDASEAATYAAARGDTKSGPIPTPHANKMPGTNPGEFIEKPNYGPAHNTDTTLLQNPLAGMTKEDIALDVDRFVDEKGLSEYRDVFHKGAMLARYNQDPYGFERVDGLSEGELMTLREEVEHKWRQPFQLYFLVVLCAGSAIVQGMDQTAVNGAQQFYFDEFGIDEPNLGPDYVYYQGLLNGAPYLCSALLGCWLNAPLNNWFGRRGTIFISCFISFAASFWMAAAPTWGVLLAGRFVLGLAVGAKSSTTPVFSSECAPKTIRGALTMQWQMWTAFGIMLGFVVSVAFQNTTAPIGNVEGQYPQWRWMLASTAIPPMIVMAQVYLCPESPRWYIGRNRYTHAFKSFCRLRSSPLQAARDLYYADKQIQVERAEKSGRNLFSEIIHNRRVRRGAQSAFFVMFMQQFCGVNVIAYYSTAIFIDAGFSRPDALLVSMGTGITNWLFAIPAVYTIDRYGRRALLLFGFPVMLIFLLWTGLSFFLDQDIPDSPRRVGMVAFGIYAFMAAYSPSEGPVPFTYSSESFPLAVRDTGMSFATATCWGFNFIISFTWPALSRAFTPTGAFGWYAAWCAFGTVYTYFLLPETKNLTLEELDTVFSIGNRQHAMYYLHRMPWYWKKYILRQKVADYPPLVQMSNGEDLQEKRQYAGSE